jgi:4-amino-4-deoxy-L-arabinose transferase-like glycosyltransferase
VSSKTVETPVDAKERSLDRRIGAGLLLFAAALLLFTEKPAGFVRDESFYFAASEQHARWFQLLVSAPSQAFGDEAISRWFEYNHEHPALMKNLYGLSFLILHEKLGLLRPAAAFRFPAFLMAALILPLLYSLTKRFFGRWAGVMAALSFLLVPRQFFESHLSCFDVPMATTWLLVVYCFVQALERPRWWIWTGLSFGVAMATKHNAYFSPVVLIPFALWEGWQRSTSEPPARALFLGINGVFVAMAVLYGLMVIAIGGPQAFQASFFLISPQLGLYLLACGAGAFLTYRLARVHAPTFRAVAPLVAMVILGPLVFFLHWPYLWHHPVDRFAWYLGFHLNHEHYTWFYLGELLRQPPFPLAYVLVKTAYTVPTPLFVPMVLGVCWVLVRTWKKTVTLLELLVLANAAASIIVLSQPSVPHFGGVKHWFPSMPFLALLGAGSIARGVEGLLPWVKSKLPRVTADQLFAAVTVLVFVAPLIASVRIYPYGTSHYSELAGGLPGAAAKGMQRQFWANNVSGMLEWVNANARPGERIYFHEVPGTAVQAMQRNDMLRKDIQPVVDGMGCFMGDCPAKADMVVYQYHQEFRETEFQAWNAFGTARPVTGVYVDETPQIVVYRRR